MISKNLAGIPAVLNNLLSEWKSRKTKTNHQILGRVTGGHGSFWRL
jgi:hypothetical protein